MIECQSFHYGPASGIMYPSPWNLDLNVSAAKSNKISSFRPPGLLFLHSNYVIFHQIPPGSVLSISSLNEFMDMTFINILFLPLTD